MERHERIEKAIKLSGKSRKEIAKFCDVAPASITQWISGESKNLRLENLYKLADITGFNARWIATGEGQERPSSNNSLSDNGLGLPFNPENQFSYPLLSWSELGSLNKNIDSLPLDASREFLMTTKKVSKNSFWLRVPNDSMISENGKGVPEGSKILIDPDLQPVNNNYIAVYKINNPDEYAFRVYIEDAGIAYLKPLNKSYRMQELTDDWVISGVVLEAKIELI